eukprot:6192400-Pleurochrysis_carterae.AAC.1
MYPSIPHSPAYSLAKAVGEFGSLCRSYAQALAWPVQPQKPIAAAVIRWPWYSAGTWRCEV